MSFDCCCCLCSSIIKFLLFSCFFLFSTVDSLPEGSHCSFEEGPCGWTLNETAASPWSIRGFTEMIQDDSFVGSTLQATDGRFLVVLSHSLCVCIYTIALNLVFLNWLKNFGMIAKSTLASVLSVTTLNVAKINFWTWFKTSYETTSATKLTCNYWRLGFSFTLKKICLSIYFFPPSSSYELCSCRVLQQQHDSCCITK